MKPTTRNPTIPKDIMIDIFSWLPVNSLMRFKCVSKIFNFLVSESDLIDIYQCRSTTRPDGIKFLVPQKRTGFYSIEMKKDGKVCKCNFDFEYDHLSYAYGLFCLWEEKVESVRIFNPSTREVTLLPKIFQHSTVGAAYLYCYSLGYEPEENKYKVFMTRGVSRQSTGNWVFTVGTDQYWREMKTAVDFFTVKRGICINGVIYMLDFNFQETIGAFDVKDETFRIIKVWTTFSMNRDLIELDGKLAVLDYRLRHLELWTIGCSTRKEEWQSRRIRYCFPLDTTVSSNARDNEILISSFRSDNICCDCYDVRRNSWRYWGIKSPEDVVASYVYSYVESLFPLKKIYNACHQV